MLTYTETITLELPYPLEKLASPADCLIFDIETTGFSASRNMIYLIGALYFRDEHWHLTRWFANEPSLEMELIKDFFAFAKDYRLLIHFNGTTFDLPFLKKRADFLGVSGFESLPASFDLFTSIRPLKKFLKLAQTNLKSLEHFLGIQRKDSLSGGDLIPIYKSYVTNQEPSLKELLLLHNYDDVIGTVSLLPLLSYLDLQNGKFEINSISLDELDTHCFDLIFSLTLETALPVPISTALTHGYLIAKEHTCKIIIHGIKDTLYHFFADYKNYYYLPAEDTAIHKSVSSYVDKEFRIPAKAATCYTKKSGYFLPDGSDSLPLFFKSYNEKPSYFEYTPILSENTDFFVLYLVKHLKKG